MDPNAPQQERDVSFLVCGLGRLGQQCILLLKEFESTVIGVDVASSIHWQAPGLPGLLDDLVIGDCRQVDVLRRAGLARCRAALLVTDDERANIAAAFAARSINPNIRLIIRSAQEKLNGLLSEQMGNLVAFEPSQFSANVFALASLGDATQALFAVEGEKMRVVRLAVGPGADFTEGHRLSELNSASHRMLSHAVGGRSVSGSFHDWDPEDRVRDGDFATLVEKADRMASPAEPRPSGLTKRRRRMSAKDLHLPNWRARVRRFWRTGSQVRRVALASSIIMLGLVLAGIALFRWENPDISWFDAVNVSVVLGVGGFDNIFGALRLPFPISPGLYAFAVLVKISSAVFLGILFAMMTERILSARLQIAHRRPRAPIGAHTIVVGLGVIGLRVVGILRDWKRPMIGVTDQPVGPDVAPDAPIEIGPFHEALERANVKTAECVVVVTDDEVVNLEISLTTRSLNPNCRLVFRSADEQFAQHVATLIPASIGIGDYGIAAEAIAAAAFGENILSAFHLDGRLVLVAEYTIYPDDTLNDRLLAEIAYGYDVAPIVHRRGDHIRHLPADDIRLEPEDRLIVLATIDGLQRVEMGRLFPPDWSLWIDKASSLDVAFDAANAIARISGCDLRLAREALTHLPVRLAFPLYRHQGLRLVRELKKMLVSARLEQGDLGKPEPKASALN
ncbi:NAD-binding protein [Methylocapsa acidiphila]|uniref:NAD-binding protein n=1 Tax=Methylocapsa acidiphila TaxID=133552 RepID=UPI0003FBBF96|nr:NAD-binding protein [Methylocapsa acidiphila]